MDASFAEAVLREVAWRLREKGNPSGADRLTAVADQLGTSDVIHIPRVAGSA